ncbi:formyltransferase family protein [Pseudomonas chlororaphis]|uniref:Formyl transferase N-terminal domain-containing protein n=1 Tax=Pseudomonas chlororaphis O6 TaxID=1037915 RepID=A0AB33WVA4_9PSED|nr:formyltransferase family protein [Pseudomonas chlororaphis]EIM17042.1 hypothetical protein PchlO6_6029 [Pseudomonas chlororaphis O6]
MSRARLLILCARTPRSVAYLQGMAAAGIEPDAVMVYGQGGGALQTTRELQVQPLAGLFCPDLSQDIDTCLATLGWPHEVCPAQALDDPQLLALIARQAPDLLVYSGYGGQLVPAALLSRYPVLHIHSGWLPDYRGSTTLYYQIIEQRECAASALLLDEQIDTGPVLARKAYPLPPPGMDVDYLYDNAIRADLLVQVLSHWRREGAQALRPLPAEAEKPPYFIIHPLLKHLALLAVDKHEDAP